MGSTFANLHVRAPLDPEASLAIVRDAVRQRMVDDGYLAAEPSTASRTVLVGVDPGRGWINVYDSTIDNFDLDALRRLGASLSKASGAAVVGTLVFDSDVAGYVLFEGGEEIDWLTDRPEVFEELGAADGEPGDVRQWRSVLPSGVEPSVFEATVRGDGSIDDVFAESRVAEALGLIGIDRERAAVGYRYVMETGQPAGTELLAYAADPSRVDDFGDSGEEAPVLDGPRSMVPGQVVWVGGISHAVVPVGATTDLDYLVMNLGGAMHGLSLMLGGSAVGDHLIRPDRIHVGSALDAMHGVGFRDIDDALDGRARYDLPDLDLAGVSALGPEQVTVRYTISGVTPGVGQAVLQVAVGTDETAAWSIAVRVIG
jgi:hypothetical protein